MILEDYTNAYVEEPGLRQLYLVVTLQIFQVKQQYGVLIAAKEAYLRHRHLIFRMSNH